MKKNVWHQGIDGPLTILRCIFCCSLILRWSYAGGDYLYAFSLTLIPTLHFLIKDMLCLLSLGSLSNYDDDHNDDFKTTIGLMIKTTALHVNHAF